jgi:hypothetical protein
MRYSFTGLAAYTYCCPQSYRWRVLEHRPTTTGEGALEIEEKEPSKRLQGIDLHARTADYLLGRLSEDDVPAEILSDTVIHARSLVAGERARAYVEQPYLLDLDYNPIESGPPGDHSIYIRPDLFLIGTGDKEGVLDLFDWKFGNSAFGSSRYYHEVSWYAAGLAAIFPDVYQITTWIHFPLESYTLPERTYSRPELAVMQKGMQDWITRVRSDRDMFPYPSRYRCRFCPYRSEEGGGTNECEEAMY